MKVIKKIFNPFVNTLLIGIIVGLSLFYVFSPSFVRGSSMYPTMKNMDYCITNRWAYKNKTPERSDIVIVNTENKEDKVLVKRVIGLPGETISFKKGDVYINGKELKEPYIREQHSTFAEYGSDTFTLGNDEVFVMGDNRSYSLDSRYEEVGPIKLDNIMRKVTFRVFPLSKFGKVK